VAIFTGRPPDELLLAYQVLGFRLPAVCDSAPHLRKPRSEGLIQLADAFKATEVVFVGDTLDDATALKGARALCPWVTWTFAAVGPDRGRLAVPGDLVAERLLPLLPGLGADR
jgi:phosphoglycolate phosphatase-like HAD superfamily hydrolase